MPASHRYRAVDRVWRSELHFSALGIHCGQLHPITRRNHISTLLAPTPAARTSAMRAGVCSAAT
jgi:hypothetical protein